MSHLPTLSTVSSRSEGLPLFPVVFPRAYPSLNLSGRFRSYPEDFIVHENLGFSLAGEGEHCLLYIEKTGQNTHWVAQQIERALGLAKRSVGYCGRKDRHAVTRQWISIYEPKREMDIQQINIEGVALLSQIRHVRKLRPGDHQSNRFTIRLRDLCSTDQKNITDASEQAQLLETIKNRLAQGLPNYFGPQRFGREGNNLIQANDWLVHGKSPSRQQRSMVMSAARAYLFNQIVAARIVQQNWNILVGGDLAEVDSFGREWPTAALWGRGRLPSTAKALVIETTVLEQ